MGNVLKTILEAIKQSGQTRYRISKETGVSQAHLSRLKKGKRGLGVDTLERLADYLDLEIIIRPKRRKRKG